jgi:hypothetical protein
MTAGSDIERRESASTTFLGLTDTPASYVGQSGLIAKVKGTEDGLEFGSATGVGDVVGPISAIDANIVEFNGITGKLIKDGLITHTNAADAVTKKHSQNTDTATSSNTFAIGDGGAGNKQLNANNADANKPNLRYEDTTNKWQFSNDGTTWTDMGAGGGGSGDVVGPASSVDNTIPRFDSTTGKLLQTSGIVIDDSDAMTFNNAAAPSILSVAATATVPTLIPNKADLDTGLGWATANALSLIAGATEGLRITQTPTGAGQTVSSLAHIMNAVLGKDTGNEAAFTMNYTTNKLTSGNDVGLLINQTDTASPGTSLLIDAQMGGTSQFGISNIGNITTALNTNFTLQNSYGKLSFNNPSAFLDTLGSGNINLRTNAAEPGLLIYSFAAATASTRVLLSYGTARTNTTGSSVTASISSVYNQSSGTASNTDLLINRTETAVGSGAQLLADFQVGSYSYFAFSNKGSLIVPTTIITPGTTGNQTINKLAGRVNIAAAGTTVTVTNSLCSANSIVIATIATDDATATVKNVVPAAGSFVINVVGVTAETAINFMVIS